MSTFCMRFDRQLLNHASAVPVIPNFSSFLSKVLCGTTSKAFFKSRKIPTQYFFSLSACPILLVMCISACSVDLPLRNPYWCSYINLFCCRWSVSFVLTIFSSILENAFTSEMGLQFSQFVVSPDLCMGMTLVDLSFSGNVPVDYTGSIGAFSSYSPRGFSLSCLRRFSPLRHVLYSTKVNI